jgi:hypothetical protein
MGRQSGRWFRIAVAAGFALGVLLLITTIYTFRYAVRHLIFDHLSLMVVRAGPAAAGS